MPTVPTAPSDTSAGWVVVVPVKGGPHAKSRLGAAGRHLADAIARDTVEAVCRAFPPTCVVVVTSDPVAARWATRLGTGVLPDPGHGLDAAASAGVAHARAAGAGAVAVLLGDHPALREEDLRSALTACAAYPSAFVPDHDGTGTALLTVTGDRALLSRFGPHSADRHARTGHHRLDLGLPGLRCDVDDEASLAAAMSLGVGRHTAEAVAATLTHVQASIHTFADDGTGSALLDDGRLVSFGPDALLGSGLRHLRPGQRVSVELAGGGAVAERVWIVGIGDGETIR